MLTLSYEIVYTFCILENRRFKMLAHDNVNKFLQSLQQRGLRIASENESGWYEVYIGELGERQSIWVTDELTKTFIIKITQRLVDLSGENPEFHIEVGAIFYDVQDEGEYFIVDLDDKSFPVMKDECEVI